MNTTLFLLIAAPLMAGLACLVFRFRVVRTILVLATAGCLFYAAARALGNGPFIASPASLMGADLDGLIRWADFILLLIILYFGFSLKSGLVQLFTLYQIVLLAVFELFLAKGHGAGPIFYADHLSLVMVAVICGVGSLIVIYALGYMARHEEHLRTSPTRLPRFFFYMLLFLGAMNGLVMADNMLHFYFFFEATTFCSFALIAHDGTPEAMKSAVRALWMNSLGGALFVTAMAWTNIEGGGLSISAMVAFQGQGATQAALLAPLALFILAGFTKAAQFPFQSWLLGAMVAPTPTSALLHSSTMVKAGVFLVLRLAPAYAGTYLSSSVAVFGAFAFAAGAALAIGQSNAKRILAYSTISNLGLIIACAGINTPLSLAAGVMLIIFHAISKGLLFACTGSIEQRIGSRDTEDMRGLYDRMPGLAFLALVGLTTMLLAPFGVILSKWMAIEAASNHLLVVALAALGSAFTVLFYLRWAGILVFATRGAGPSGPPTPASSWWSLWALGGVAVGAGLAAPAIFKDFVAPMFPVSPLAAEGGVLSGNLGAFAVFPLFLTAGAALAGALWLARRAKAHPRATPYLSGAQARLPGSYLGPLGRTAPLTVSGMYLEAIFGEKRLDVWINTASILLLAMIFGGSL